MEFSGQYLNYEEYKSLGGTLDIMPFNILEFESRKRIDERTQNRLKDIEEILNCGTVHRFAFWAHNPKMVGSTPTPATKIYSRIVECFHTI